MKRHATQQRMAGTSHGTPRMRPISLSICAGILLGGAPLVAAAQSVDATSGEPVIQLAPIVVVATTPLLGLGTPLTEVPADVQTVHAKDIENQHRSTLTDFFEKNLQSVAINDAQGNPYQMDVNYRGFTASPLLGAEEGLSVFLDGVRINERFGDVVNWDLIPQQAIETMQLVPGSNPTYGLNTLGGALVVDTKNGRNSPSGDAEIEGGSWGRKSAQIEQGGTIGQNLDYYVTGDVTNDNGWGYQDSSQVRQGFGKLRYTDADTTVSLSAGGADNALNGSQTIPQSFLDNPRQAYTFPDSFKNSAAYVTLSGDHYIDPDLELSGNIYYRHFESQSFSSNTADPASDATPLVNDASCAGDATVSCSGSNALSQLTTNSYGASVQLAQMGQLLGMKNQVTVGVNADVSNSTYTQSAQDAIFTASRQALGIDPYVGQTAAGTHDANLGTYLSDTLNITQQLTATLSGRYDWATATIGDESGQNPALDGHHTFSRFNPAIGLNWNPTRSFTAYASYNEGMRSPTAIELACADPSAPCSLPNDFLADPALKPVVARTFEIGARGRLGAATTWNAALYRTTLYDDIQFINDGVNSAGYYQNVGSTRRQGFELGAHTQYGPIGLAANYSYIDASYLTPWTENSSSNSSADANGNIQVKPGDRIPGIPANAVKLRVDYTPVAPVNLGANFTWRGSIFSMGNENNQDVNGKIASYFLIDLDATWNATKQLQFFATISNLLNRQYASFGVLGQNYFNGPGHTWTDTPDNEQFYGMGAPRGFWLGVRYAWK